MKIYFDVAYLYYLPHFEPVIDALLASAADSSVKVGVTFISEPPPSITESLHSKNVTTHLLAEDERLSFYQSQAPDWVIFGHAADIANDLNDCCKTALILHGLGPKSTYYNASSAAIQYRFVESEHRKQRLEAMYPNKTFINTGYTKLDPIINDPTIAMDLTALGLNPAKPTLLYSPTFYPSTIENFPKDWPQQFSDYNILIKPHYLSLIKSAYKKQRLLLERWATFSNVYLADMSEQSLVPFMATADIMISETSSALFEFIALDKPVIIGHFLKLRWGYRGILKFRLNKRLSDDYELFGSMGTNINRYSELKEAVELNIQQPQTHHSARQSITQQVVGNVDGQCSQRVANFLLNPTG
ncbi:CDP-glycerol glycerophosphotransferase family protein [Kangiella marina]|uniref:CDP-glycerol--poly(Glycerophosphate) glycerophosphotransferase n=1 Tax=Kangiella marina TaxID=1079178 RepID=A0ABP8IJU2_9GAMM